VRISPDEELAAVLRHTVRFAVARDEKVHEVLPLLGWVAGDSPLPVVLALESCRRDLAAAPTSSALAQQVVMFEHAANLPTPG
jgi:hypothetical protein